MGNRRTGGERPRLVFILLAAASGLLGSGAYALLTRGGPWTAVACLVVALLIVGVAMAIATKNIHAQAQVAPEQLLFETWFPLGMGLVPLVGIGFALMNARSLLRGRLGAAVVTTGSERFGSASHHDAVTLGRAGVPAGLVLIWCSLVVARGVSLDGRATLVMEGGRLVAPEDALEVREDAEATLTDVAVSVERGSAIHVEEGTATLRDVTLQSGDGPTVRVNGNGLVTLAGGRVTGQPAMGLGRGAAVARRDTQIDGQVESDGVDRVAGPGADLAALGPATRELAARLGRYANAACAGVTEC